MIAPVLSSKRTPSTTVAVDPHARCQTLLSCTMFCSSWFRAVTQRENPEADGVQPGSTLPKPPTDTAEERAVCGGCLTRLFPFEIAGVAGVLRGLRRRLQTQSVPSSGGHSGCVSATLPICSPESRYLRASGRSVKSKTLPTGDSALPRRIQLRARANWAWLPMDEPMSSS